MEKQFSKRYFFRKKLVFLKLLCNLTQSGEFCGRNVGLLRLKYSLLQGVETKEV